jgi:hypothetical protein
MYKGKCLIYQGQLFQFVIRTLEPPSDALATLELDDNEENEDDDDISTISSFCHLDAIPNYDGIEQEILNLQVRAGRKTLSSLA